MEHLRWVFLQAAVRHAQRPEVQQDPKTAVIEYLDAVATKFMKIGHYSVAYQAKCVVVSINTLGTVNAVYKLLKSEYAHRSASIPSQQTPASNTGVTPFIQTSLEEYINGNG